MIFVFLSVTVLIWPQSYTQAVNCTYGSENVNQQSAGEAMAGLYLDTSHPVECSGLLTDWMLCHYRTLLIQSRDYQVELQVWRQNSNNQYSMVGASMQTIAGSFFQDSAFNCRGYSLSQTDHIQVEPEDVIGVHLALNTQGSVDSVIRLLGSTNTDQDFLLYTDQMLSTTLQSNMLSREVSVRMHISATIVAAEILTATSTLPSTTNNPTDLTTTPATFPPNTTATFPLNASTILWPSQDGQGQTNSGGLSGGAVAGIIITLLILLAIGVVFTVMAIVVYKRKEEWKFKISRNHTSIENNGYISNVVYEAPTQRANTSIFSQLDRGLKKRGEYEIPIGKERNSQESVYVDMEGARSSIPAKFNEYVTTTSHPEFQDQESDAVPYYDSFDEYDDSEDYAEMSAPSDVIQTESRRKPFNIYASFGPNDFIYSDHMKRVSQQTTPDSAWPYDTDIHPYQDPPEEEDLIVHQLSKKTRTLKKSAIQLKKLILKGNFVKVHRGLWKGKRKDLDVVVKSLESDATQDEKIKLLQEAVIMGQFHHPNILQLYGIINEEKTTMVITEYTDKGTLLDTVKSATPDPGQMVSSDTPTILLSYSQQVALGMHYLATKGFIHRNLEAKNIIVTCDNICKIGGLTLSKHLSDAEYYISRGGCMIAAGWTAPEALCYNKYSSASDVWSYGCLLYEIWSLGKAPFCGVPDEEISGKLQAGYRLSPPPGCPKTVYSLMIHCWNPLPNSRPNFHAVLNNLLDDEQKTLEVPIKDSSTHKQATLLGGPLSAGANMYKTLQNTYQNIRFSIVNGEILYEEIEQYQVESSPLVVEHSPVAVPYLAHTVSHDPTQKQSLPTLSCLDNDEIYDDIVNSTTEAITTDMPNQAQLQKSPPTQLTDEIYEDIANSTEVSTQAFAYEVPDSLQHDALKLHIPTGTPTILGAPVNAEDDYDEI